VINEILPTLSGSLALTAASIPSLARVVGFILTAPPFSSKLAPNYVKIGIALIFWLAIRPTVDATHYSTLSIISLSLTELAAGLSLGFLVQIAFTAFDIVGELVSNGMGLSFPGSFDPIAVETSGPASGLVQMAGIGLFISVGGLELMTSYLAQSYDILPYGDAPSLLRMKVNGVAILNQAMTLGVANSVIIWGSLLIANILMLISSRLSGGLNLMSSGLPLLLLIGLGLLAGLLFPTMNSIWSQLPTLMTQPSAPR
jgi:flagellar biosynthetic protein FliR